MADWTEFIDSALDRLSGKQRRNALPQLAIAAPEEDRAGKLVLLEKKHKRKERQVKQRLSYQLLEKMRRRSLSWKSYYYHDQHQIPRLAITNDNATGARVVERRYIIPYDQIIEANFHTDQNGSVIFIDVNDLQHIHRNQFDQLERGEIQFQVYDKVFGLRIWYGGTERNGENRTNNGDQLQQLGRHKIFIDKSIAFLLRPFRNLGADGFAAVANRLLIQEDVTVDGKNAIESLLMELGNEELLQHYQSALDAFNQKSALRRSAKSLQDNSEIPLIITKANQQAKNKQNNKDTDQHNLVVEQPVPDSIYQLFAIMGDNHFAEIEEDLLYISLSSISFDRSGVLDGCSILKDKLHQYVETDLLSALQLEHFYQFLSQEIEAQGEHETIVDPLRYSPLEDEAYEEISVEILEDIRQIVTDYRYFSYPPISTQINQLQEVIQSLGQALEDARELHRRREITDPRQILTQKAFELPNDGQYELAADAEHRSYYDHLLDVQQIIGDIQSQMLRSVSDVSLSLTKSAFLIVQLNLHDFPTLEPMSVRLLELMAQITLAQQQATANSVESVSTELAQSNDFELEIIDQLVQLTVEIQQILETQNQSGEDPRQLQTLVGELEQICLHNQLFSSTDWHKEYIAFADQRVVAFNDRIFDMAIDRRDQIQEELENLTELVDTFISGVSVPALLPAQLHESGNGLQTYLVQELQGYLNSQNLQLHTVPGREQQLQSLLHELLPKHLDTPLEQIEYFFRFC